MAFHWPPKMAWKSKELISQVLWTLKLDGPIEGRHATGILIERLSARGVLIDGDRIHALRIVLKNMDNGRYGGMIERTIHGRDTVGIRLRTTELPENYLPEAFPPQEEADELVLFEPEPVATPNLEPRPVQPDDEVDLIAAGLAAELEELRRPAATVEPAGAYLPGRDLNDKNEIVEAVIGLVGKLGSLIAAEAIEPAPSDVLTRLREAVERAERFRRRALDAEETAEARKKETMMLRRQIAERDARLIRLEANVEALLRGEQAEGQNLSRVEKFIAARPHNRRDLASFAH